MPMRITGSALVITKKATPLTAIMPRVINTAAAIMTLLIIAGLILRKAKIMINVMINPARGFRRCASASI